MANDPIEPLMLNHEWTWVGSIHRIFNHHSHRYDPDHGLNPYPSVFICD